MAMDIKPASALRTEYSEMAAHSRATGRPVYITKNGEGDTVLMDLGAFERREDELLHREAIVEHRAAVLDAELKRLAGAPTYSSSQVSDMLKEHFAAAKKAVVDA